MKYNFSVLIAFQYSIPWSLYLTCTLTYSHTHTYTQTHSHSQTHTHTLIPNQSQAHSHIHTHTHIYVYIYILIYPHIYTLIFSFTHTNTHTHTYIYIYIYTRIKRRFTFLTSSIHFVAEALSNCLRILRLHPLRPLAPCHQFGQVSGIAARGTHYMCMIRYMIELKSTMRHFLLGHCAASGTLGPWS